MCAERFRDARQLLALSLLAVGCGSMPPSPAVPRVSAPISQASERIDGNALRAHVAVIADDSMMGRAAGSRNAAVTADYIERHLRGRGFTPVGSGKSFRIEFSAVELRRDSSTRVSIARGPMNMTALLDAVFRFPDELLPIGGSRFSEFTDTVTLRARQVVFAGTLGAGMTVPASAFLNRVVIVLPPASVATSPVRLDEWLTHVPQFRGAAAVLIAGMTLLSPSEREALTKVELRARDHVSAAKALPPVAIVSRAAASSLLDVWVDGATPGYVSPASVSLSFRYSRRNIGSLAVLAAVYPASVAGSQSAVLVSTHYDHLGVAPADHAGRAYAVRVSDSIFNGANDGATGTAALLAIADYFATNKPQLRHPVVFAWSAGGDHGELGLQQALSSAGMRAQRFVAGLHVDMLGRGLDGDLPRGGAAYVEALMSVANSSDAARWRADLRSVAAQHGLSLEARVGGPCVLASEGEFAGRVPLTEITTGWNPDHLTVADEMRSLDLGKLVRTTSFVAHAIIAIANRDVGDTARESGRATPPGAVYDAGARTCVAGGRTNGAR